MQRRGPWPALPAGASHWGMPVTSWTAIAGIGFIALGVFYLPLDLPAETSWAPWGCIAGGAALLTAAVIRSRIG